MKRMVALVVVLICCRPAFPQAVTTPPVAVETAGELRGYFRVTLSTRSPLSDPKEVAKRVSVKPTELKPDYDLSQESFTVYVPKEAGADAKYGLIVGLSQHDYGWMPKAWPDLMEKHHLIWIGNDHSGDERDGIQKIGVLLDAVAAMKNRWPIDDRRVYVSANSYDPPAGQIALYYPDVFDGMTGCFSAIWYKPFRNKAGQMFQSDTRFNRPIAPFWGQAVKHSAIFYAYQSNDMSEVDSQVSVERYGFRGDGFQYVKFEPSPLSPNNEYVDMLANWMDDGLNFLDEVNAKEKPSSRAASTVPTKSSVAATPARADSTAAEKSALSTAKMYVTAGRYDEARARLQKVISTYPGSPTAVEAKQLLDSIAGK